MWVWIVADIVVNRILNIEYLTSKFPIDARYSAVRRPQAEILDTRNSKRASRIELRESRGGFTLTEVLLVVLIIALVGGAGGGLYVSTYKRLQVDRAARDFLLTAQYARIMAIEQQSRYTMQLDAANKRFWLTTGQLDAETGQTAEVEVQDFYCKPVEMTDEVSFEDVQITPMSMESQEASDEEDAIAFLPNGTAQTAVVQIGDGKTHYAISIDAATGKATLYFGTAKDIKVNSVDLDAE
jgi:prepilin-type N-terminal cleavage/methylation domain-containing protein